MKKGRPPNAQIPLNSLGEETTEDIRPCVIGRRAKPGRLRLPREGRRVGVASKRQTIVEVDACVTPKRLARRQAFRRLERIRVATSKRESLGSCDMGGKRGQCGAVV